jgi:cell division protein FtsQ
VAAVAAPNRTTGRVAVLVARRPLPDLASLVPSGRSVLVGLLLVAAAVAAYVAARDTRVFAVERIEVTGGPPRVQAEVQRALGGERGRSLLRIDDDVLSRRLAPVPDVLGFRYDRAFPHTLRVAVTPERAVLLLRRGHDAWAVSARGRVLRRVLRPRSSTLPRLFVPRATPVTVGATLARANGAAAAAAVAPLGVARLPARVRLVRSDATELTFVLRSGLELRLGDAGDLRLKLAIARRILLAVGAGSRGYVDVSVPERPVSATGNPQVEG